MSNDTTTTTTTLPAPSPFSIRRMSAADGGPQRAVGYVECHHIHPVTDLDGAIVGYELYALDDTPPIYLEAPNYGPVVDALRASLAELWSAIAAEAATLDDTSRVTPSPITAAVGVWPDDTPFLVAAYLGRRNDAR